MLVAGEETKDSLSAWPRAAAAAAAAQQASGSERVARERQEEGRKRGARTDDGRGSRRRKKKTHGLLVGRFSVSLKFVFFIFLSLPFDFLYSCRISYVYSLH